MENKLTKRTWLNIILFSLMGGVAWNLENMYFNTFLYGSIYEGVSAEALAGVMAPTTAISRMVALSAVTAVVTTFIMGTLSEKMKKRKVFISIGYIIWGITTAAFGFISRPLEKARGAESYVTSYNGITLRVTFAYDIATKKQTMSVDTLYGFKTLYPELAVRVLG